METKPLRSLVRDASRLENELLCDLYKSNTLSSAPKFLSGRRLLDMSGLYFSWAVLAGNIVQISVGKDKMLVRIASIVWVMVFLEA